MSKSTSLVRTAALLGAAAGNFNWRSLTRPKGIFAPNKLLYRAYKARRAITRYRPRARRLPRRKWQAKARRQVAAPRNYSTSKTAETVFPGSGTNVLLNAMSVTPILNGINKGTGINERMRDSIVISGVKIDMAVINNENKRLYVNWAIVHPKQDQTITNTQKDFFRDYTDQRSWDANLSTKSGITWANAQINTDDYVILKRGKFLLAPGIRAEATGPTGYYNIKDCQKEISHWLKLGRQFTFTDDPVPVIHDPIYFVIWCADPMSASGTNLGDNGIRYKLRCVTYFRDPKSG